MQLCTDSGFRGGRENERTHRDATILKFFAMRPILIEEMSCRLFHLPTPDARQTRRKDMGVSEEMCASRSRDSNCPNTDNVWVIQQSALPASSCAVGVPRRQTCCERQKRHSRHRLCPLLHCYPTLVPCPPTCAVIISAFLGLLASRSWQLHITNIWTAGAVSPLRAAGAVQGQSSFLFQHTHVNQCMLVPKAGVQQRMIETNGHAPWPLLPLCQVHAVAISRAPAAHSSAQADGWPLPRRQGGRRKIREKKRVLRRLLP